MSTCRGDTEPTMALESFLHWNDAEERWYVYVTRDGLTRWFGVRSTFAGARFTAWRMTRKIARSDRQGWMNANGW